MIEVSDAPHGPAVMTPDESFAELMQRLRGGEDSAAHEVFQRYARQLVALARKQLHPQLGAKVDAEDVVQSAYKSFFLRHRAGKLEVGNWNSLWKLLLLITLRKCADRVEYFRAERRNTSREVSRDQPPSESGTWLEAIDREPTPVEAAILTETVQHLLSVLEIDERPILELSLQGYTTQEISEQLGRAERSVRRLRERVRKRLERMQVEDVA
jgi:RNA polymerase sigma-70 factor (ECF subfamily)